MRKPVVMPPKPSYRLIRELAGNPAIVAASTALNIRECYEAISKALVKVAKEKP